MILFVIFFSIGAASMGVSILCDDLIQYYRNRQLLRIKQQSLNRLKSLNTDYDILLEQLEKDPNLIKRLAPATLGTEPEDKSTFYPKAAVEQLAAASKALMNEPNRYPTKLETVEQSRQDQALTDWIVPCSGPRQRIVLFLSGAFLIIISCVCFCPTKDNSLGKAEP